MAQSLSEHDGHADAGRELRSGAISFVDRDQVRWRVIERDARYDPGTRGQACLVFASEQAIRRVWVYPARWRSLSDSELEALSWSPLGAPRAGRKLS